MCLLWGRFVPRYVLIDLIIVHSWHRVHLQLLRWLWLYCEYHVMEPFLRCAVLVHHWLKFHHVKHDCRFSLCSHHIPIFTAFSSPLPGFAPMKHELPISPPTAPADYHSTFCLWISQFLVPHLSCIVWTSTVFVPLSGLFYLGTVLNPPILVEDMSAFPF